MELNRIQIRSPTGSREEETCENRKRRSPLKIEKQEIAGTKCGYRKRKEVLQHTFKDIEGSETRENSQRTDDGAKGEGVGQAVREVLRDERSKENENTNDRGK